MSSLSETLGLAALPTLIAMTFGIVAFTAVSFLLLKPGATRTSISLDFMRNRLLWFVLGVGFASYMAIIFFFYTDLGQTLIQKHGPDETVLRYPRDMLVRGGVYVDACWNEDTCGAEAADLYCQYKAG